MYTSSYRSLTEQVRVEQRRVACGACKDFWDGLDALALTALAQVTLPLLITRFPNGRGNQCAQRHGERPVRLPQASAAQDSVPVGRRHGEGTEAASLCPWCEAVWSQLTRWGSPGLGSSPPAPCPLSLRQPHPMRVQRHQVSMEGSPHPPPSAPKHPSCSQAWRHPCQLGSRMAPS